MILTDSYIRGVKGSGDKRLEISDDRCAGLRLRVSEGGVKTFAWVHWDGAKTHRLTLGRHPALTLADARRLADKHRAEAAKGEAPTTPRQRAREVLSFDALADAYVKKAARDKRSWEADEYLLRAARAAWGSRPAAEITRRDIVGLLDDIAERSGTVANRTQSVLRTLLGWATREEHIPANPLAGEPKRGGRETPKERALDDAEIAALWRTLDSYKGHKPVALALKTILLTCCRPGEVSAMRRDELADIDGKAPEFRLPRERTKNGRAHVVPLSSLAVAVIKEAIKLGDPCPFVFRSKWDQDAAIERHSLSQAMKGKKAVVGIVATAGIKPATPHDLRRTGATLARGAGVPRENVQALLNHTPDDVTATYDRYEMLAEKRAAVKAIASAVKRILSSPSKIIPA